MTDMKTELDAVIRNLESRTWIQGAMNRGEAVCAHGAVMTCKELQPGDEHIIRAVIRNQGLTEDWNDSTGRTKEEVLERFRGIAVTDEALANTFGPQWTAIVALVRRAAILTDDCAADEIIRRALDGEAGNPVGHRSLRDRFPESFKDYQTPSWIEETEDSNEPLKVFSPWDCPDGPHRGPEGPNEDLGQCAKCWSLSHVLRPEGETFGHHLSDCSLPIRHGGECIGGGTGHPAAPKVRGPRALDGEAQS